MARHTVRRARSFGHDVNTTTTNTYVARTPNVMAVVWSVAAPGMNTCLSPMPESWSANDAMMCTPVNTRVSPPSQLCRSSHQAGRSRSPVARAENVSPQANAAAARTVATMPLERVRYHQLLTLAPQV